MKIFITKTPQADLLKFKDTEHHLVLELQASDTIKHLRKSIIEMIEDSETKVPIVLSYNRNILEDHKTIQDYQIVDRSVVFLYLEETAVKEDDKKLKKKSQTNLPDKGKGELSVSEILPGMFNELAEMENHFMLKEYEKQDRRICWNLGGYDSAILALAVSKDSQTLVSAAKNGTVKVLNLQTKQELSQIQEKFGDSKITAAAVSPTCTYFAYAVNNQTIVFQPIKSKVRNEIEKADEKDILSLAVSDDDKYIVSGSAGGSIKVFDLQTKAVVHHFKEQHTGGINSVAISKDSNFIVSGSTDKTIKLVDLKTQKTEEIEIKHQDEISMVAISNNNRYIISASKDKTLKIFDRQVAKGLCFEKPYEDEVKSLVISNDDKYFAIALGDKSIKMFELESRNEIHSFVDVHKDNINCIAISNDGQYIISGSEDKSIGVHDLTGKPKRDIMQPMYPETFRSAAISDDDKILVVLTFDNTVKVFDFQTRKDLYQIDSTLNGLHDVGIIKDSKFIILLSYNSTIQVWDLEKKEKILDHKISQEKDYYLENFDANNECVALIHWSEDLLVFNIDEKKVVCSIKNEKNKYKLVRLASDNRFLVLASKDRSIEVIDIATQELICEFKEAHESGITSIRILGNNTVVSGSSDGTIKGFNIETKKQIYQFENIHEHGISQMQISNDNKYIASSSHDNSIKIHNIESKLEVFHVAKVQEKRISSIKISNDNNSFISTSCRDGRIMTHSLTNKEGPHYFQNIHEKSISCMAVSDDSQLIVVACGDGSIKVYDFEDKREKNHFKDIHFDAEPVKDPRIFSIALSKDLKIIVFVTENGINVFDFQKEEKRYCLKSSDYGPLRSVVITNDSKQIISHLHGGLIKVFDIETQKEVYQFKEADKKGIIEIVISEDDKYLVSLVSLGREKSIKLFDLVMKQELYEFKGAHEGYVQAVKISSENKYIVSGGYEDKTVKIFDLQTRQLIHHFKNLTGLSEITALDVSDDNKFIFVGSYESGIKMLDIETKQELHHFKDVGLDGLHQIKVSKNSQRVFSRCGTSSISVIDLKAKDELSSHEYKNSREYTPMALNSDRVVIGARFEGCIVVFDLSTKKRIHQFKIKLEEEEITQIKISENSKLIGIGTDLGSIIVYDLSNKKEVLHTPVTDKTWISSIFFTKDMNYVISQFSNSIKVFGLYDGKLFHNYKTDDIRAIAVSDDCSIIAAGYSNSTISVYAFSNEVAKCKELFKLKDAHRDGPFALAISKDNRFVVSGSSDRIIKVYDIQAKQEIHSISDLNSNYTYSMVITEDSRFIIVGYEDSVKVFDLKSKQQLYQYEDFDDSGVAMLFICNKKKTLIIGTNVQLIKFLPLHEITDKLRFSMSNRASDLSLTTSRDLYKGFFSNIDNLQMISSFQTFITLPYIWNVFHLAAITNRNKAFNSNLCYSNFKVKSMLDVYNRTPLHYLVAAPKPNYTSINIMLEYIIEYLEDKDSRSYYEIQQVTLSLSPLFLFIVTKTNPKIKDRYLSLCIQPTVSSEQLPQFGDPRIACTFSKVPILQADDQKKIFKEGQESIFFSTTMLYLDYDPVSDDMFSFVLALGAIKAEDVFRSPVIIKIIDHLWKSTKFSIVVSGLIFSTLMLLFSIYIGLGERALAFEIVLIFLASLLMIGEFIQIHVLRSRYFSNIFNTADIINLSLMIAFLGGRMANEKNILAEEWLSSLVILFGYLRWISYLRYFKTTRNLIEIIISIIKDMYGFIIVLIFIFFGFALIFLEFNRDQDYGDQLYGTYKVLYGDIDDSDKDVSQKLFLSLILFILNVILLNLLISIMGDSYDRVQERRVLTDSLTRLDMILEGIVYRRLLALRKKDRNANQGHMIYCEPNEADRDEDSQGNEWEGRINLIKKTLRQNDQKVDELKGKIMSIEQNINKEVKDRIDGMENRLNLKVSGTEHKVVKLDEKITNLEDKFVSLESKIDKKHNEILEAIKAAWK